MKELSAEGTQSLRTTLQIAHTAVARRRSPSTTMSASS